MLLLGCSGSSADARDEPARPSEATTESPTSTLAQDSPEASRPRPSEDLPDGRDVVVTSITDGDTFRAGDERVRLIGVDTPEVSGGVECFGREATAALDRLIPPGTDVRLVADVEPVDRYDRTLAYVYRLDDGTFVNLALARDGYAQPLTIPPDVAHAGDFAEAAAEARDAGRGLWSACPDDLDPVPPTTPPVTDPPATTPTDGPGSTSAPPPSLPATPGEGCDPAYPDGCIPPAPPDLDCRDVPFRYFTVLAPDPHHFDGGGDGRGCEGE